MKLIFIRHGAKAPVPGCHERDWPLSEEARLATERLSELLRRDDCRSDLYLHSAYCHALETATILRGADHHIALIGVEGLTPRTDPARFSMQAILDELEAHGRLLQRVSVLTLVGHEDRLSNLAKRLTRDAVARLARLEALVLEAESLEAALAGHSVVAKRLSATS